MRNPFPPWKPGFYRLVRNTGCLDKSNLSCSICICIRRQRALRRLRVGTHRRGRVPFEIRVFANTRAHTPLFSLSLSSLRVSPYLFISASALTSSHPRREKSPSSLLLLLLEFSIVPLNFVPRLSRLAIEVFCGLSFISKRLLPAFPLFPLWRANRQRWSNRQVCSFWIAKRMYFGGEGGGVRRCSWQTMRDIWTHGIYIYTDMWGGGRISSWKRNLIPQSDEGSPWLDTSFQFGWAGSTSREVGKRVGSARNHDALGGKTLARVIFRSEGNVLNWIKRRVRGD